VKSHNDWIVDLYYKEMVAKKNMEKNHGQHSKPTEKTKGTSRRNKKVSAKLPT
tara:strand:- start:1199 stop:1357 length:159 start_codon:yes stop_codon:yes gene_type:complete